MNMRDTFFSRWSEDYDKVAKFGPAKVAMTRALDAGDRVRQQHAAVTGNKELTPLGRQNAMRKFLADTIAPDIRRTRKAVDVMRTGIEKTRARLQPKAPDPSNFAQAVLRSEYRTLLRGMKPGERAALLLQADVDPVMVAAVLEVPPGALMLPAEVRLHLVTAAIEKEFPGQLAALDQAEEVAGLLTAALQTTANTARLAAEMDDRSFAHFVDGSVGAKAAAIDAEVGSTFFGFAQAA